MKNATLNEFPDGYLEWMTDLLWNVKMGVSKEDMLQKFKIFKDAPLEAIGQTVDWALALPEQERNKRIRHMERELVLRGIDYSPYKGKK